MVLTLSPHVSEIGCTTTVTHRVNLMFYFEVSTSRLCRIQVTRSDSGNPGLKAEGKVVPGSIFLTPS
jgi:hypothetical protein